MKTDFSRISGYLKSSKGKKLLVIALLAAIVLIFCSEFIPSKKTEEVQSIGTAEYEDALEKRLKKILSAIGGVGECEAMVCLEGSGENIYAKQKNGNSVRNETENSGLSQREERNETEEEYIIIEKDAGEEALIEQSVSPKVSGVIIVCDGGDDSVIREKVISAVSVALGIGSNKVYVTRRR